MESPLHSEAEVAVGGGGGSSESVAGAPPLEAAEKIILRWDSTVSEEARERMIFAGDRQEADRYLLAVDEIQRSMSSTSINADEELRSNTSSTIQIAMARLEDEFQNILLTHSSNAKTNSLLLDPADAASSSSLLSNSARSDTAADDYDEDGEERAADPAEERREEGGGGVGLEEVRRKNDRESGKRRRMKSMAEIKS